MPRLEKERNVNNTNKITFYVGNVVIQSVGNKQFAYVYLLG